MRAMRAIVVRPLRIASVTYYDNSMRLKYLHFWQHLRYRGADIEEGYQNIYCSSSLEQLAKKSRSLAGRSLQRRKRSQRL